MSTDNTIPAGDATPSNNTTPASDATPVDNQPTSPAGATTITSGVWEGWDRDDAIYWAKVMFESGTRAPISFSRDFGDAARGFESRITRTRMRADLFERGILPEIAYFVEVAENWRSWSAPRSHAAWLERLENLPRPALTWAVEPATWRVREPGGAEHVVSTEVLLAAGETDQFHRISPAAMARILGLPADDAGATGGFAPADEGSAATGNSSSENEIMTTGTWRSWTPGQARDWVEVFFAFRTHVGAASHKIQYYAEQWAKFRAQRVLPSYSSWPNVAADYEARGLGPDDYAAEQTAAGAAPYGEPGRVYLAHAAQRHAAAR